jgi:hypothetical protein
LGKGTLVLALANQNNSRIILAGYPNRRKPLKPEIVARQSSASGHITNPALPWHAVNENTNFAAASYLPKSNLTTHNGKKYQTDWYYGY